MQRGTLIAIALLWSVPTMGGHGFTDTFADIDWLPPPGATPAGPGYFLDGWLERLRVGRAGTDAAKVALLLEQARERLAEAAAMIRSGDRRAADIAIDRYALRIAEARRTGAGADTASAGNPAARIAEHLLQHQYIVSVEYPDWPAATRTVAARIIALAQQCYAETVSGLSRPEKDALFFKEAEVQWSWAVAREADRPPGPVK